MKTMNIREWKRKMMWKYYHRYKSIGLHDSDNDYTVIQKLLMLANYTKTGIFGEYWTPKRLENIVDNSPQSIANIIYSNLSGNRPCMIARYGANEQRVVANYLSIKKGDRNLWQLIEGRQPYWWWNKLQRRELKTNAGFFPNETVFVERYANLMMEDTKMLDVLLTWYGWEPLLIGKNSGIKLVSLYEAEPWWQPEPWTRCLRGKKVLVVHPFAELIEEQYQQRKHLFANPDILPEFELHTIKAVQSINGECSEYANWFEALSYMKKQMDTNDYDIALIGCGAYGFCLAAHAKRMGKKAFHMGGVLQLLFGIKGRRWESASYHPIYNYSTLFNNYWVKPGAQLKPPTADDIEGGCYW